MRPRRPIRVLVVDDSAFVRQALSRMLGSEPDIQVVGLAADVPGVVAVENRITYEIEDGHDRPARIAMPGASDRPGA